MVSLLLAAALAAAPSPPPAAVPALDRSCFALMAELAEHEDGRVRSLGMAAAQYFLGRIDEAEPGFDPDAERMEVPADPAVRERLLAACGETMGHRDFRTIGDALARRGRPVA